MHLTNLVIVLGIVREVMSEQRVVHKLLRVTPKHLSETPQ
jgi:hypothetical protein